jgi:hypothetical protein
MALSWNEIKERAIRFSKDWENALDGLELIPRYDENNF